MTHEEHMRLVRAYYKAFNAFNKSLKESGYHIEYDRHNLNSDAGIIIDERKSQHEFRSVGKMTLKIEIDKEENL